MATDTLELDLYDLQAEVGDLAGYGMGDRFGATAWNPDQKRRIDKCVNIGTRSVYFTEEMEEIPAAYQWSFLQPRSVLAIPSGSSEVDLPADFNGLLADLIPASTDGTAQFPIRVVSYSQVYAARSQGPSQVGRPEICCESAVKGTSAERGGRYKLQIFPTTDAAYTAQVWYEISPRPLSPDFPHPYGGAPLADTFRSAVRSAYETDYDGVAGVETDRFLRRLRAAIAADRKHKPLTIGYNGDRSDGAGIGRRESHGSDWGVPFLVNGTAY